MALEYSEVRYEQIATGELKVKGRLVDASNATLFGLIDSTIPVIYKPIAGERPLWDFQDGNLASREVAAYEVSRAAGFGFVPYTIFRDGPYGPGAVQQWIDIDEKRDIAIFSQSNDKRLRSMALMDAVINNTDRKMGHLLLTEDDRLFGCDHGVTFHVENKLRTVLWQWAGQELFTDEAETLSLLQVVLAGDLGAVLKDLLLAEEIRAMKERIEMLLQSNHLPSPTADWPAVPWPPF